MEKAIPSAPRPSSLFIFSTNLLLLLLLLLVSMGDPRTQTYEIACSHLLDHNTTVYVPNSVAMMENISAQIGTSGFGVAQIGSGPDINYGLAQCYGDIPLLDCLSCYAEARTVLPQCFPFNGGRIFLDGCFMRSENYSFFEEFTGPEDRTVCSYTTRKSSIYEESARRAVLEALSNATNNTGHARAQVEVLGAMNESVYVLAECWRSLNTSSCRACLASAFSSILGCLPWSEGWAFNTGCFMRYSDMNFLNPELRNRRSRSVTIKVIAVAIASSVVVLIIVAIIGFYIWKKKRKGSNDAEKLVKTLNDSSLNFKYSTLEKATESFADANKLGQGGFGTVYKGVLADGREIAVKRLFFNSKHRATDFYNEVNIISSVEHKNLVRFLGFSCSGPENLLVYDYLPNKSLDGFIFDSNRGKALNWERRYDIIIGTVEGLVHLHENPKNRIIHRDIKASNILLDSMLQAKIADFGLARTFEEDKSHISATIAGTLGYMAPEYLIHGQLTDKADVYNFGVLLLEIVSGRQNNRSKTSQFSDNLICIVWKHFQAGTVKELFDPNLMLHSFNNSTIKHEVLRVVHIGLLCTQGAPALRPSMSKVLVMLEKNGEPLPIPTNPPFMDENAVELNETPQNQSYPKNTPNSTFIASMSCSSFYPR